ncbi:hypothetical protein [Streptomyces sp. NPDC050263]|uniref:hypothetical protein n=1 Tax=Streptomyces sp. NPDC050263 TaxID=3155037 RepID=UPI003417CA47
MAKKIGRLRLLAGAAAAAGALTVAVAAPASAIHTVDPFSCTWDQIYGKKEYFAFHIQNSRTGQLTFICYADAGSTSPDYANYAFSTGNNAGIFLAEGYDGKYWSVKFDKWQYQQWMFKNIINLVIY